MFCGDPSVQVRPNDAALPQLVAVQDLSSALLALETIVIQGEGSTNDIDSHYARFTEIKVEYESLFAARPVARNPVMRPPPASSGHLQITAEPAASLIDLANAVYVQMLRSSCPEMTCRPTFFFKAPTMAPRSAPSEPCLFTTS